MTSKTAIKSKTKGTNDWLQLGLPCAQNPSPRAKAYFVSDFVGSEQCRTESPEINWTAEAKAFRI